MWESHSFWKPRRLTDAERRAISETFNAVFGKAARPDHRKAEWHRATRDGDHDARETLPEEEW